MASTKAKAQKTVLILHRYFVRLTRSVVYRVRNGEDKVYLVTLNANGTAGCFCETDNEPCKAAQYGRTCYHIKECQKREQSNAQAAALAELCAEVQNSEAVIDLMTVRYDGKPYEEYEIYFGLVGMTREEREAADAEMRCVYEMA